MENLGKNLVDQVFLLITVHGKMYIVIKKIKLNNLVPNFYEECIFGGMEKQIHAK